MNFNLDPSKQNREVIFSRKSKNINHPPLFFNNIEVSQSSIQKYLGIILNEQLTFWEHLNELISKTNKTIGLLRKVQNLLQRSALIITCKVFVRPHLDYDDTISDTLREKYPNTEFFMVRIFRHSDCGKIRTRKNSVFGHFSRSNEVHNSSFHYKLQ